MKPNDTPPPADPPEANNAAPAGWMRRLVSVFYKCERTEDGVNISGLLMLPFMLPFLLMSAVILVAGLLSTLIPGHGKWSKSGDKWYEWEWNSFR